jgi:hypothetical protein
MFATIIGDRVYVRLSRRNLRQLDAILDDPDVGNRCLARKDENGVSLVVQVEDDADHYEGRDPGPGVTQGCVMSRAVGPPERPIDDRGSASRDLLVDAL